ncbi:MAG: restriction endonuclease subunit S [Microcystis sp.]
MMTKKWQPYPTYKDSGVEWLGAIPEHWKVKKLKYLCKRSALYGANESASDYINEGVRFLRTTDIDDSGNVVEEGAVYIDKVKVRDYLLEEGDLLLSRSGTIGRSFLYHSRYGDCAYAGYLVRFIPGDDLFPKFAFYFTKTIQFLEWLNTSAITSTIGNVNGQKYANMFLSCPPLPEQQKIAEFLDQETSKIDKLITKKERLIELLKEKRTALISHAVTKGLNPDVPMKDSGVEWLGEIPEHWKVLLLKRIANIRYGLGQPPPEILYGTPLIRATNVKSGRIFQKDMIYIDPKQVPESRNAVLAAGEIIVVRSGAYTGDSALIPEEYHGSIAGYDMVTTVKEGSNQFIAWQLLSSEVRYIQFAFHQLRAAQPHLNAEELRGTIITFPPLPEQQKIAQFLDRETSKIDNLITKTRTSIDHLKEYRTALISAAVTGKIDVREH